MVEEGMVTVEGVMVERTAVAEMTVVVVREAAMVEEGRAAAVEGMVMAAPEEAAPEEEAWMGDVEEEEAATTLHHHNEPSYRRVRHALAATQLGMCTVKLPARQSAGTRRRTVVTRVAHVGYVVGWRFAHVAPRLCSAAPPVGYAKGSVGHWSGGWELQAAARAGLRAESGFLAHCRGHWCRRGIAARLLWCCLQAARSCMCS